MRLSYDDFCRCSPDEFESICEAYQAQREADSKDRWERMRLLATITIQPHVRRKITAQKLLPLPWDKPKASRAKGETPKPVSAEEGRMRFERLVKRTTQPQSASEEQSSSVLK